MRPCFWSRKLLYTFKLALFIILAYKECMLRIFRVPYQHQPIREEDSIKNCILNLRTMVHFTWNRSLKYSQIRHFEPILKGGLLFKSIFFTLMYVKWIFFFQTKVTYFEKLDWKSVVHFSILFVLVDTILLFLDVKY